jgi:hypothetical protein
MLFGTHNWCEPVSKGKIKGGGPDNGLENEKSYDRRLNVAKSSFNSCMVCCRN